MKRRQAAPRTPFLRHFVWNRIRDVNGEAANQVALKSPEHVWKHPNTIQNALKYIRSASTLGPPFPELSVLRGLLCDAQIPGPPRCARAIEQSADVVKHAAQTAARKDKMLVPGPAGVQLRRQRCLPSE